ncbi:hypothetical protein SSX86_021023 [Deinandra increscens subsp. villosa]|uniref:Uncharacterized protein n=1 Tax=Deinandra increscens subsp. villosa TaxID=3103831 RepID=A0AAP0CP39_9ASTR
MEEQTLQPVPELIDGNFVEEAESYTEEAEVKKEEIRMDDEEFYERIEAPKFVDFTKPYTYRTDDRYWFCSRVGCDQKHEEEINHEEISKNFVLRVLAARSPNVKLRRALNREHSSIKCPLSAPAKPSKPRIPRLAMVSSLISDKNGDTQRKIGPCSKVSSTPVAKSRQVAAKYMTTPRNKMCHPKPNSFRSIQNPKTATVDVPKSRTVAKALVFHSPKKAIILKRSVELQTPLTKICEGMKRLGIASEKKTLKGSTSKPKKPETEESSRRQLKTCRSEKKSKDLAPSNSTQTRNKKNPSYKCQSTKYQVVDVKLSDGSTSEFNKKEDLHPHETSETSNSHPALGAVINDLSNRDDKENMVSAEDHSNEVGIDDGNENALNPEDNNRSCNQPLGDKILGKEILKKNKVVQTAGPHETSETSNSHALGAVINDLSIRDDKENIASAEDHSNEVGIDDGKENALNPEDNNRSNHQPLGDKIHGKEILKKNKAVQTTGPGLMKCKKPKPTSIKPFRLRTDERGILKEAILEKKLHLPAPVNVVAKDTSIVKRAYRVQKNEPRPNIARTKRPESAEQRSMTSLKTRSQRVVSPRKVRKMPGQQLGVIDEKSSRLPSDVMVVANKSRAVSAARSTSRGKRHVTVAKEPNFHTSHLPRTCSKKVA